MTKEEKRKYQREYMQEYRKKDKQKEYQRRYLEKHRDEINAKNRVRIVEKMKTQDIWYSTEILEHDTSGGFFESYKVNYYEENNRNED